MPKFVKLIIMLEDNTITISNFLNRYTYKNPF